MTKKKNSIEIPLRVILYQEDGEWNAHCLELDLVGCGATPNEANQELEELVTTQISFALWKKDFSLLNTPAPKEYFERWEQAQSEKIRNLWAEPRDKPSETPRFDARMLEMSETQFSNHSRFSEADAPTT